MCESTEGDSKHIDMPGPINVSAREFVFNLRRKISFQSGDDRAASFLFQRLF